MPAGKPAPASGSLDEVRATPAGIERFRAAVGYIARAQEAKNNGLDVRDEEIRRLHAEHGTAETARLTGLSPATVKTAVRAARNVPKETR